MAMYLEERVMAPPHHTNKKKYFQETEIKKILRNFYHLKIRKRRWSRQTTALILICLFALSSTQDIPNCLNCEDFNRQNLIKCPLQFIHCGECVAGNIPDELDSRICFALEIVRTPPKLVEGVQGTLIELPCEFNSKVECAWERNGHHVNIDYSPRYLFKSKGVTELTPAEDCTLIIEDLNSIDVGEWQCGSRATSSTISVKSAFISVVLKEIARTTESVLNKFQELTELSNGNNALHLYLDDKNVDRRVISMMRIMNGSVLECRSEVEVSELRWEMNGKSIAKQSNSTSIQMKSEDILKYFNDLQLPFAKTLCKAINKDNIVSSYVFITKQGNLQETEQKDVTKYETNNNNFISIAQTLIVILIVFVLVALAIFVATWFKRHANERVESKLGKKGAEATKLNRMKEDKD